MAIAELTSAGGTMMFVTIRRSIMVTLTLGALMASGPLLANELASGKTVVLYGEREVTLAAELSRAEAGLGQLWVTTDDLQRINGFELKPEGACREEVCIPIDQTDRETVKEVDGTRWFNLTRFAERVGQAYVQDAEEGVWSFGAVPAVRDSQLGTGMAPDFALPNLEGETVRLSDFRGKKVLIVTWASW